MTKSLTQSSTNTGLFWLRYTSDCAITTKERGKCAYLKLALISYSGTDTGMSKTVRSVNLHGLLEKDASSKFKRGQNVQKSYI